MKIVEGTPKELREYEQLKEDKESKDDVEVIERLDDTMFIPRRKQKQVKYSEPKTGMRWKKKEDRMLKKLAKNFKDRNEFLDEAERICRTATTDWSKRYWHGVFKKLCTMYGVESYFNKVIN